MSIRSEVHWKFKNLGRGTVREYYYNIYVGRVSPIVLRSRRYFDTEQKAWKAAERAVKRIHKET